MADVATFIARSGCSEYVQYLQIGQLDIELDEPGGGGGNSEESFAAQVLSQTPKLRLLSVEQGSLGQCIDLLRYLTGKEPGSDSADLPCPDLEAVNFCVSEEGHGPQGNGDTRYIHLLDGIAGLFVGSEVGVAIRGAANKPGSEDGQPVASATRSYVRRTGSQDAWRCSDYG